MILTVSLYSKGGQTRPWCKLFASQYSIHSNGSQWASPEYYYKRFSRSVLTETFQAYNGLALVRLPCVVTELFFHLYYGRYSHVHLLRALRAHGEKFIETKNQYIKKENLMCRN